MDDLSPATKADVKMIVSQALSAYPTKEELKVELSKYSVKEDIKDLRAEMNRGFARIGADIDRLLTVMINIDKKYETKTKQHDRRIGRLEKHTGLAQAA